ncbi:hypothetical protein [Sinimarinibacterium flocculans]|uniref:Phosphate-selective porin O/P n=1 Tax=Sinimarinibacterium flocculans TaxID=985250 RepID=A0A318E764_9GAMM|nr:hypothetical protein [Sinimarinibacterium flocculans]PXV66641.1 hypothetical protein C8D93_107206 [Sinimarinibacterium flocculans]
MTRIICGALAALPLLAAADDGTLKLTAELSSEARWYVQDAAWPEQSADEVGVSFSLLPELYYAWNRDTSVTVRPFARWDSIDDERSHLDLRELMLQHRFGNFDLRAGVGRVFWGVTESVHLVDIVNQTDLVENPDGEDKLGQPMLSLAWTTDYGSFTGYVLPYFRERTLPGPDARLRAPLPVAIDDAVYESSEEEKHVDAAVRWSLSTSLLDVGLSHFSGTARDPRFEIAPTPDGAVLVPVYDQIEQTGLDLNVVTGGWIWKLEAIHQTNCIEDFTAAAGGFEYTFSAPFGTGWDVGALAEFLWDERGSDSPSPFQRDLFVGTRIAANDVAGTELLAGAIVDTERGGAFGNIEASRRIGNGGKLVVEMRLFMDADEDDPLYFFRRDDYLQLEYIRYF